jgi:hypothetical protein
MPFWTRVALAPCFGPRFLLFLTLGRPPFYSMRFPVDGFLARMGCAKVINCPHTYKWTSLACFPNLCLIAMEGVGACCTPLSTTSYAR